MFLSPALFGSASCWLLHHAAQYCLYCAAGLCVSAACAGKHGGTGSPRRAAFAKEAACCMLQLLCLMVRILALRQLNIAQTAAAMAALLEECNSMHKSGVAAQDPKMVKNKQQFLEVKYCRDGSVEATQKAIPDLGR